MAAYASLVSLMHIIDQIQIHPHPPISLDKDQVESLTEKITFLQDFLEGYSHVGYSKEADALEMRIADVAYAAEDIIESHIVDQIHAGSTSHGEKTRYFNCFQDLQKAISQGEEISSIDLYQGLQKVMEEMDSVKKEVMEIKENVGVQDHLLHITSAPAGSLRPPSTAQRAMVDVGDILYEIMDKLTGGQSNSQIFSIVGMGGIGKTTLARNIYENQVVVQHFDILAWGTISQEYSMKEILLEILVCLTGKESKESLRQISETELGEILHKSLLGRSYLIILDDVWQIEAWYNIKLFCPDNNNGSRIMLTTRLSNLALQLSEYSHVFNMKFLDDAKSWSLFCKIVFGEEDCPLELKEIGEKIVENCKGLPLSINVIGGLLARSQQTQQYWQYIVENLNSIVNLDDNEHCLRILYMSYNSLPVHLKACFLYMGFFPEDDEIVVRLVITLWVVEGFVKPVCGKSLEEAAEEYLKELIDRNLILVKKNKYDEQLNDCIIHDLLRDLCLREARKHKFFSDLGERSLYIPQGINTERRIYTGHSTPEKDIFHALESASLVRSLICEKKEESSLPCSLRLLRVLLASSFLEDILPRVNLRLIYSESQIPSSISLFWNLQAIIIVSEDINNIMMAPPEIWKMPFLRCVYANRLCLPDPLGDHMGGQDDMVLENLQTLINVYNFKCGEEVVKRIPNIKELGKCYKEPEEGLRSCCLDNLGRLHKLEYLNLDCDCGREYMQSGRSLWDISFPHSLKKLTLRGTHLHWEEISEKIGSLPLLQVLKLEEFSSIGREWKTVEGQFCSLIFLLISECNDLEYWMAESSHFPRLEGLFLRGLPLLEEIPSSIGDIPTLLSIKVYDCSSSTVDSAKRIQEEQEELGNESLRVEFEDEDW